MVTENTVTWKARLIGPPSLTLGWTSVDGRGGELSYLVLPAEFRQASGRAQPGIISIFASDKVATAPDSGLMMIGPGPTQMATLATSRTQFTELVYFVQANRAPEFEIHVGTRVGPSNPVVSWAVSIELRNS